MNKYHGLSAFLYVSPLKSKKYRAIFFKDGVQMKHADFGAKRYEDYTIHKDDKRKKNYIQRHSNEKDLWENDPFAPATLSRFVLWEKPDLEESWKFYKNKFDLQ